MKIYLLAIALILASCGQSPRSEEDPFAKTGQGQTDKPSLSQRGFEEKCARTPGGTFKLNKTVCFHTPHKLILTKAQIEEKFQEGDVLDLLVGNVAEGSAIWAEVKGGFRVNFFLNGNPYDSVEDALMSPRRISAGRVTARLIRANYESLMVIAGECFDRTGNIPCDKIGLY
jgi:hypothetical protein